MVFLFRRSHSLSDLQELTENRLTPCVPIKSQSIPDIFLKIEPGERDSFIKNQTNEVAEQNVDNRPKDNNQLVASGQLALVAQHHSRDIFQGLYKKSIKGGLSFSDSQLAKLIELKKSLQKIDETEIGRRMLAVLKNIQHSINMVFDLSEDSEISMRPHPERENAWLFKYGAKITCPEKNIVSTFRELRKVLIPLPKFKALDSSGQMAMYDNVMNNAMTFCRQYNAGKYREWDEWTDSKLIEDAVYKSRYFLSFIDPKLPDKEKQYLLNMNVEMLARGRNSLIMNLKDCITESWSDLRIMFNGQVEALDDLPSEWLPDCVKNLMIDAPLLHTIDEKLNELSDNLETLSVKAPITRFPDKISDRLNYIKFESDEITDIPEHIFSLKKKLQIDLLECPRLSENAIKRVLECRKQQKGPEILSKVNNAAIASGRLAQHPGSSDEEGNVRKEDEKTDVENNSSADSSKQNIEPLSKNEQVAVVLEKYLAYKRSGGSARDLMEGNDKNKVVDKRSYIDGAASSEEKGLAVEKSSSRVTAALALKVPPFSINNEVAHVEENDSLNRAEAIERLDNELESVFIGWEKK